MFCWQIWQWNLAATRSQGTPLASSLLQVEDLPEQRILWEMNQWGKLAPWTPWKPWPPAIVLKTPGGQGSCWIQRLPMLDSCSNCPSAPLPDNLVIPCHPYAFRFADLGLSENRVQPKNLPSGSFPNIAIFWGCHIFRQTHLMIRCCAWS